MTQNEYKFWISVGVIGVIGVIGRPIVWRGVDDCNTSVRIFIYLLSKMFTL